MNTKQSKNKTEVTLPEREAKVHSDNSPILSESAGIAAAAVGRDPHRAKVCMLILTQSCNLNCTYCYERFKSSRKMEKETALNCIQEQLQLVRESSDFDWLFVDLFGGEPLLNFEVIRFLVEWVRANVSDVDVFFKISSNGTLLTDEMKTWFAANRDYIFYGVSYDGSLENQLRNRGRENMDAVDFSRRTWPAQAFHMVLPPESLATFSDTILQALREGYRIRVELAGGIHWPRECSTILLNECRKLKTEFLSDPTLHPVLIDRFFKGGEDADMTGVFTCGSGIRSTCYDVDGRTYPCQMFTPLCVGDRAIPLSDSALELPENREDPECVGCPIRHWCPTCYGMNYVMRGHTSRRDHGMCHMHLALALATAEFQSEKLALEPLTRESAALVKFLLRIRRKIEGKLNTNIL